MDHKAWIVAVDMGYGHQRAAYPLRNLSPNGKVLIANNYSGIPRKDFRIWNNGRKTYEFFSRTTGIPLVGKYIWGAFDKIQAIDQFYPRRDLSRPSIQVREEYRLIRGGFGKDLIEKLNKENIPLITTFFTISFMAEEHGFKNDIYTVICDSDISRAWVGLNPAKSRIKYFASCRRVVERLKLYGVPEKNIYLTGFPLPVENIGNNNLDVLKSDLKARIIQLDPEHHYRSKYGDTIKKYLPDMDQEMGISRPFTVTFAVGGAGAQRNLAKNILLSLRNKIINNEMNLNLVAGSRSDVYSYFKKAIIDARLVKQFGLNLNIVYAEHKDEYFKVFNECLRTTDVLWTKPSELVFYSALGLPIIMAPSVGSQEDYNRTWLKTIGAGISQQNPMYCSEWLFDWVKSGWLAEAAMAGFLDARQFGVRNISDVIFKGAVDPSANNQLL